MKELSQNGMNSLLMKLYDRSSEAIFFFDEENRVVSMNQAAEQILDPQVAELMKAGSTKAICMACKGFTSAEEEQTCIACYMSDPDRDIPSFQVFLETAGRGIVPYTGSIQMIDRENGIRVFMLRDLTEQIKTQESMHQQTLVKRVIKAQEGERKRISRELHDSVAQEMLSALVDLRVLKYMNVEEDVLKKVKQTEGSLMRLLEDIRHLSVQLRPATLDDLGLEAAFRTHFKWIEKNYGMLVDFSSNVQSVRFDGEIETVVYRVCQEAVFNALKYAGVEEVEVALLLTDSDLKLTVEDRGSGFDLNSPVHKGTGLGLFGMRERAELVHADLTIRSGIGTGTVIELTVPLNRRGDGQ
ncbi:ATP-binding protein [Sporosarcina koreensis]|uniref:sensor histidine kinase n=1 Tax=Sporosarcina koreensis TaxID=334735 RepID=UPI000B0C373A|nr:ATP-binding protein [Sporosarcina koreensis]